jgi:hypothetical protein
MIISKRPFGISILAILAFIVAIAGIANLIAIISRNLYFYMTPYIMRVMWINAIIMAILLLSLTYGFLKRLLWSWFLAIIILVIGIILQVRGMLRLFGTLSAYPGPGEINMPYIIIVYIIPFVVLVIYGSILFYLTRPHIKTYFGIGQPGDITSTVKENKRTIVFIAAFLVMIAGICIWGFMPADDIKIISVSQEPENPQPGDTITVIAEISGGSPFLGVSASLHYNGLLKEMVTSKDDNKYSFTFLYPVEDSTEKWYVISAGDKTSEVFEIGRVKRSNITSLAITDVVQIPEKPTTSTSSVEISAKVTSNYAISKVTFEDMHFNERGGGSGEGFMMSVGNDIYKDTIFTQYYEVGTRIFYRIKAIDESGNIAITPVYTFTLTDNLTGVIDMNKKS